MMTSVGYAKWTKVAETKDGSSIYIELDRIRKNGDKIFFWGLKDIATLKIDKNTGQIIKALKIYYEAECGRFRLRMLTAFFYSSSMGKGDPIQIIREEEMSSKEKSWTYPPPDTRGETMLKAVCNHNSMQ